MISLFFSYSHADEALRDQLEKQLSMLKRQGVIETWHDRRIGAGQEFGSEIDQHVETDDIILLLVSPDFLASDYCYETEMLRAIERHENNEAVVIPVILRACDWHSAPFGRLLAAPTDGKPVTQWPDIDQAFLEVALAVKSTVERIGNQLQSGPAMTNTEILEPITSHLSNARSSNLRIAKEFTEKDKDQFQYDSFEYIARFFKNSLDELQNRNSEIEASFRRVDGNRFTAAVYRSGDAVSRCTVFIGSAHIGGIAYSNSDNSSGDSFNENMSVAADDQQLYLKAMGMASFGRSRDDHEKMSMAGGAELYWDMFVRPLQNQHY